MFELITRADCLLSENEERDMDRASFIYRYIKRLGDSRNEGEPARFEMRGRRLIVPPVIEGLGSPQTGTIMWTRFLRDGWHEISVKCGRSDYALWLATQFSVVQ
jgi:hypothetical protein